ncbi:MAG: patatin family protein [Acidaminococcaceae bacterium]
MTVLNKVALVLEGGGMRGMFSAGVFEAFLQQQLDFPYVVGVSAGACNVVSYLAHQPLRTRQIITNFVGDPRYCSKRNWLRTGSLFGFDFILQDIPRHLLPFDYATFLANPCQLQVGATDCNTGEAVWFSKNAMGTDFTPLRASASLPFLAPIVSFQGHELLDGGLAAPIPIAQALASGYKRFVVVLTRNAGYRKTRNYPAWLLKLKYKQYPHLLRLLEHRAELYNQQLEQVEQLAAQGAAVIIRPTEPLTIGRLDLKPAKLLALHDHGTICALDLLPQLLALNNTEGE